MIDFDVKLRFTVQVLKSEFGHINLGHEIKVFCEKDNHAIYLC